MYPSLQPHKIIYTGITHMFRDISLLSQKIMYFIAHTKVSNISSVADNIQLITP